MTVVAGKTQSGRCFNICRADLNRKCTIETRENVDPDFGETKVTESFSILHTAAFKVQTVRGTRRFAGVAIDEKTTHLFICEFKQVLRNLDGAGEHFMRQRGKLYRVIDIHNIDESDRWMLFESTERGLDTAEESNA